MLDLLLDFLLLDLLLDLLLAGQQQQCHLTKKKLHFPRRPLLLPHLHNIEKNSVRIHQYKLHPYPPHSTHKPQNILYCKLYYSIITGRLNHTLYLWFHRLVVLEKYTILLQQIYKDHQQMPSFDILDTSILEAHSLHILTSFHNQLHYPNLGHHSLMRILLELLLG